MSCSATPSLRIGLEGVGAKKGLQLAIFTETVQEALRMKRTAEMAESWRVIIDIIMDHFCNIVTQAEDIDDSPTPCQLGVCDDRLLCLKQEEQTPNNNPDINICSPEDNEDLQSRRESNVNKYSAMNLVVGPLKVVSSSLGLEKNSPGPGGPGTQDLVLAWSRSWTKVLHLAVDYDNCNIQMVSISSQILKTVLILQNNKTLHHKSCV